MITEDYVSFEVAKLLKEKGFDEKCKTFYNDKTLKITHIDSSISNEKPFNLCLLAPTLQMAMKWLRKACAIEISVACFNLYSYRYDIYEINSSNFSRRTIEFNSDEFVSYEEACEAAIKYCLTNLI